ASTSFASAQHVPALGFVAVSLVGVAGSLAGSWGAYVLGYAGGRPLIERWGRYLLIRSHEIDRAEAWFGRHGEAAVFWTRLVPLARAFISLPAGVAGVPLWRLPPPPALGVLPRCFRLAGGRSRPGAGSPQRLPYFPPLSVP